MAKQDNEREAAIARLYSLPLSEFTEARDELAGRLRKEGNGDAAAEVKRLRKPSVAAWALNQVRRGSPQRVEQLIDAGGRLRDAQEELLGGAGREALDRAAEHERRLVAELAQQAERELSAAGRAASTAVQEKLRGTLHAAATDPEAREGLRAGRLVREYTASGLGPLPQTQGRSSPPPPRKTRQLEGRLERARDRHRQLDSALADSRSTLREARKESARAASRLERAVAAEEHAAARAQQARDVLAELESVLRDLRSTSS